MKNMTFKIDDVMKKHLAAMAKTDRRSSSDFLRLLLAREWDKRVARNPTLAQVDAARTTADDLTPGGPVVYETRPE
jgi:predicted transcriptional regulator